jgi:transketolase
MSKATRQAFGEALAKLGETHPEIVVLDADLAKSTKSEIFMKKFPERFFEMGIQEANMIGVAAGLAFTGKLPFLCSFGAFLTGRFDTIRLSVAYSAANVRLIGTHAGVGIGDDGHSQMALEDIALMRTLPGMGVFQPMDARDTELLMDYLVNTWKGPAYLRLTRQNLPNLAPTDRSYDPLKITQVKRAQGSGKPVVLVGTGGTLGEAAQAAEKLQAAGISTEVWNVTSFKPFDRTTAIKLAQDSRLLVTVEDHSVIGGLGDCFAEVLSEMSAHAPLVKLGIQDQFGESGEPAELYEKFGISADKIAEAVRKRLG